MSQVMVFAIGVGLLLLAVGGALWLAEPSAKGQSFRVAQGRAKVDVSGREGAPVSDEEVVQALKEALSEAESRLATNAQTASPASIKL